MKLDVRVQLLVAFGGIALLMLAVVAIAWFSYSSLGLTIHRVANDGIPTITNAFRTAEQAKSVVVASAELVTSRDREELDERFQELLEQDRQLGALIAAMQEHGADAGQVAMLASLREQIIGNLHALKQSLDEHLRLGGVRRERMAQPQQAKDAFSEVLRAWIDRIRPGLVNAAQAAFASGGSMADVEYDVLNVVTRDTTLLQFLMELQTGANLLVSLYSDLEKVRDPMAAEAIAERVQEMGGRMRGLAESLPAGENRAALVERMETVLAAGESGGLLEARLEKLYAAEAEQALLDASRDLADQLDATVQELVAVAQAEMER